MPPTRLRFPKAARLFRAAEFAKLKREGQSFHGKLMVLSVVPSGDEADTRIGLVTSRRVGGAVVRNRVRRRLREIVRAARPTLRSGLWLALIARQGAARATYQALLAEWTQLAQRSSILSACS
jgi:ribonuclease P protein component